MNNSISYFFLFLLVILFYMQYNTNIVENMDLCQPFEENNKQCPYRIHYRQCCNLKPTTAITDNNTNNKCQPPNKKSQNPKPNPKPKLNCPLAFGKYPVCDASTNNLLYYPWVAK